MKNRAHLYKYADGSTFRGQTTKQIFDQIAEGNYWKATESVSGIGSSLAQTAEIIRQLPSILKRFRIHAILDIPCGDFNWMQKVDLTGIHYRGGDIVGKIVAQNQRLYQTQSVTFTEMDLLNDLLPKVDLLFCRDCLVHLSFADSFKALANIRESGALYFMTTTFPDEAQNKDIPTGGWRPLNLQKPPFSFPEPILLLNENCTEMDGAFADKSLGLWRIAE